MKKKTKGYVAIIAAFFIPLIFSLFYLNMYVSEINHNQMIFENAVKQTALRVARQRLHYLDGNQQQTNHLNRIAAITFNDWMKVKTDLENNLTTITVENVKYLPVEKAEWGYFNTSLDSGYLDNTTKRHWTWYIENIDFSNDFDPDKELTVDYTCVNDSANGFKICLTGDVGKEEEQNRGILEKKICNSTTNMTIETDNLENVKVTLDSRFGRFNKNYTYSFTAAPPKLNADIVLCLPVNVAACHPLNDPYVSDSQIDSLYQGTTSYDNNAAKGTPIWQIKTAFRHFLRQIIGYKECGVGIIPYCGNVAIQSDLFDYGEQNKGRTVAFNTFKYSDYSAINPQVSIAESYKFAAKENEHLSTISAASSFMPSGLTYTPILYRSDMNSLLEKYMKDGTTDVSKILYSLVDNDEDTATFMRRSNYINYAGNINVLAGYSTATENTYPHPYPMIGLTEKISDIYRYLVTFAPFAHHSNKSNFLYLPLMFGASMLKKGFCHESSYTSNNTRKKCLILVDNIGDLFAPHELTYFGLSNDASCLTLVNGDKLDYENGDLDSADGYYQNKVSADSNFSEYDKKTAIKCNYIKDATNGTYTLKTSQPGNIKIVVKTNDNLQQCAKLYQDNLHASDIKISNITKVDEDEVLPLVDNYYACNLNTSYKITFENIDGRKSPVAARLELIECEIDSLMSLDNKYVLRQDENYVYICYGDDAYTNGIENDDSSLDQNTVIIKFKQATEVTDYLTLSYVGQTFLDSSVYISPYTQTYVLGNVYNAVLDGAMNIDGNISSSYNQNGENVFYTGYSPYYCPESSVYYSNNKYDVEELCRLCLSNVGRPDIFSDLWKELASDWVYGNDNWYGFSNISDSSTLNGINAEYGGGENLAPNHIPEGESFPQIKVYKTNQYDNNVVVNDVYTYTEGCFVADMGDYFNIYSILGNHPSFDITISNPDQAKNVYARMQTFGFDIDIDQSSENVSWRQDSKYIYVCYKNDMTYGDDNSTSISIVTQKLDSDTDFIETNHIDGLFSKLEVSGCTCGGGILDGDKYTHTVTKSEYDDLGTLGCMLHVNDSNVNVKYKTYYEDYSVYESSIVGSKEIFHGIDLSVKHDFNYSFYASYYDDAWTVSDSSGCWYYPDYDTYYGPIDSYYPAIYKVIITGSAIDVKEECGCGMCKWTIDGEKTKFEYSAQTASDVDGTQPYCNFKIQNAESIQFIYDINGNKATYYYPMYDSHHGKLLNFNIYSNVYDNGSTCPTFKHYDSTYTYESSYWYEAESIMTITANTQETTISRIYKSAEDGDKIPVPYAIVYKKPGRYVSSIEGEKIDVEEYDTVSYVSAADSSSIVKEVIDTNNNIIGWKCYVLDGLTYNVDSAKWQLNDYRIPSRYIISFVDSLPAYPVLTKIKCFNVNIPGSENDTDNQDNVLIRQDGEYYYVCNRTSADTELNTGISTADISFYSSTDTEENKKLPLSYANMRLLWWLDNDSGNSYFSFSVDKNPYVVYSYNCNLNASASYSDTINHNYSYTIDDLVKDLNVYASHIESNSENGCTYNDYFLSYKNTPDNAMFDSSAIISSISAYKYQDKYREFKTIDSNYNITLSSSKPSYSTSYALTSGYNVIYIPRQGDKDTTWDSASTFDLEIELNNAKICSIEWSNHLNGQEGCYPCDSSDGYGATDDSGNLAVYYEPIKRGKNCRWINCYGSDSAVDNLECSESIKFDSSDCQIICTGSNSGASMYYDTDTSIAINNIWHLSANGEGNCNFTLSTTDLFLNGLYAHADFNIILNNIYGKLNVNTWFTNVLGTSTSKYNYMTGVGRYFQPEHDSFYINYDGNYKLILGSNMTDSSSSVILGAIECTNEVNRILMAIGAQKLNSDDHPDKYPSQALKEIVTPTMVEKFKSEFGENGRIYVIHYRKSDQQVIDSAGNVTYPEDLVGTEHKYNYHAKNLDELNAVLSSILVDIKEFAGSTDAQIIE